MVMQKGMRGGGGRHGAGHSSKNEKPGYMSGHGDKLDAYKRHGNASDNDSHNNLMSHLGGGCEGGQEA